MWARASSPVRLRDNDLHVHATVVVEAKQSEGSKIVILERREGSKIVILERSEGSLHFLRLFASSPRAALCHGTCQTRIDLRNSCKSLPTR
jgi:hypothetical protein